MTILNRPENTPEAWSSRADQIDKPALACGWSDLGQHERMRKAVRMLAPRVGETLLDWGAGTGALTEYLPGGVDYQGFDWATGMVIRAQREHPGHRFQDWEPSRQFDLVACVGPFNLIDNWSKQYTWATLRRLWDMCRRRMVVFLYAGRDQNCLVYTPDEVRSQVGALSWDVVVEQWRNDIVATVTR